jgi:Uma2 family endonuclease
MTLQGGLHATVVWKAHELLRSALPPGFFVRSQMPLGLAPDSEPEPDLAVIEGNPEDFSDHHPETAVLIVEVSEASLLHDTQRKKPVYARAGIPEHWIFDLRKPGLEVHRDPAGGAYHSRRLLHLTESVSPLFSPEAAFDVASFFPQRLQGG